MASYPATPSFGGPFRFSNQGSQAHHGGPLGMPQMPYQQPQAFNPALHGAPGTHAGVGSANAFAFSANSHGFVNPYPSNGVPPPPPPPPPPGFPPFSHFPNGSFPPPPFPPIPIPRYGSVAQSSAAAESGQRPMSSYRPPSVLPSNLPPKPPPVLNSKAETIPPTQTSSTAAGTADREDGELSDAEMSRITRESRLRNVICPISSSQNRGSNDANGVNQRDERQTVVSPVTNSQEGSLLLNQLVSSTVLSSANFFLEYARRSLKEVTSRETASHDLPPPPRSSVYSSGDFWPLAQDGSDTHYIRGHRESLQSLHTQEANGIRELCPKRCPESQLTHLLQLTKPLRRTRAEATPPRQLPVLRNIRMESLMTYSCPKTPPWPTLK